MYVLECTKEKWEMEKNIIKWQHELNLRKQQQQQLRMLGVNGRPKRQNV